MYQDYLPVMIAALSIAALNSRQARDGHWLELPTSRFWELVARADRPIILLTARGWLRKRPCYLLPYHSFVFYTYTRPERLPEGASLVAVQEALA